MIGLRVRKQKISWSSQTRGLFPALLRATTAKGRGLMENRHNAIFDKTFFPFVVRMLSSFCYFSLIRLGGGNVLENGDVYIRLVRLGCSG